jgi:hypothetical protein
MLNSNIIFFTYQMQYLFFLEYAGDLRIIAFRTRNVHRVWQQILNTVLKTDTFSFLNGQSRFFFYHLRWLYYIFFYY